MTGFVFSGAMPAPIGSAPSGRLRAAHFSAIPHRPLMRLTARSAFIGRVEKGADPC